MSVVTWSGALTNRGNVLTTELNSLTNNSYCAASAAYDNTTNLDQWFWFEFIGGGSITPTAGANLQVFVLISADGTNYDDAASANNVGFHQLAATIPLQTNAHTVRALSVIPHQLPPAKMKFVVKNNSGVTLTNVNNILRLWSDNEAVA